LIRKAKAGRIVSLSSGMGSLTLNSDPTWVLAKYKMLGYCGSKAAVNMMTVQLTYELRNTAIEVNAVNPGFTATTRLWKTARLKPFVSLFWLMTDLRRPVQASLGKQFH
jgi:NAD(P)-dependent dehydrogenase (short-subunit alcohol dehydrogenase family)